MPKYIIGFIFGVFFSLSIVTLANSTASDFKFEKTEVYSLYKDMQSLHSIKINNVNELEKSLEINIAAEAVIFNKAIEANKIPPDETKQINNWLQLISVMNEKFEFKEWRNDTAFKKAMDAAQKRDLDYTNQLRCRDWSKPMWVGKPKC